MASTILPMSKEAPPSRTAPQFVVRLPDEAFRERIAEAARVNNRSMNAEIVARLQQSFEASDQTLVISRLATQLMLKEVEFGALALLAEKLENCLSEASRKANAALLAEVHKQTGESPGRLRAVTARIKDMTDEVAAASERAKAAGGDGKLSEQERDQIIANTLGRVAAGLPGLPEAARHHL